MSLLAAAFLISAQSNLAYLRELAHSVVDASLVKVGAHIPGGPLNSTGRELHVPGGTQNFYPAFWIRDAAMMLGGDLVPATEVEGWIRLVASVQPGPAGIDFAHGLHVPGFSVPDHIALDGAACWYPGAYADQGVGNYGYLPPADDAFYFIQMIQEHERLAPGLFTRPVKTTWGEHALSEVAARAFDSVETDPKTGLVVCESAPQRTRVDWGFCDSISKTGACLMPSLLRWQASRRLAELCRSNRQPAESARYGKISKQIQASLVATFYQSLSSREGFLLSATGVGRKDDVWASAFAVWLGILPHPIETAVSRHLLNLYRSKSVVDGGQIRHLPKDGPFGGYWEKTSCGRDTYQNGGYWATPTGWLVTALAKVDRKASQELLSQYVGFVRQKRTAGAPYEWINSSTNTFSNANYGSSAGLVYISLMQSGFRS